MNEERPIKDAREALEQDLHEPATDNSPEPAAGQDETIVSNQAEELDAMSAAVELDTPAVDYDLDSSSANNELDSSASDDGSESNNGADANGLSKNHTRLIVGGTIIVVLLIVAGLFLPPISLGERLGIGGDNGNNGQADPTAATADLEESAPAEGIELTLTDESSRVKVKTLSQEKFLAGDAGNDWITALEAIPGNLQLAGDVYELDQKDEGSSGSAKIAVPASAQPFQTLDLYGWNGQRWFFIASQVSSNPGSLISAEEPLPLALALMQTLPTAELAIGAEALPAQVLPAAILPYLTEISVGTLTLADNGQLKGELVTVPSGSYRQFLRATNTGVIVDSVTLSSLLSSPEAQQTHNQMLVDKAYGGGYSGVNLDYQGVPLEQSEAFTTFVEDLAESLHKEGLDLVLTLETPLLLNGEWDTAGQDWAALGAIADAIHVQMPLDPTAYGDNGDAQAIVEWATRQIERSKVSGLLSINAIDAVGDARREVEDDKALANFGELDFVKGSAGIEPGESVDVVLSGTAGELVWDPEALTYKYTYEQGGQPHEVWLGSEAILGHQGRFANRYHINGLTVRGLGYLDDGTGYATAVESLLGLADAPQPQSAAIVWTVEDETGGVVASSSGDTNSFSWEGSEVPGKYVVRAEFAHGDSIASLGSLEVTVAEAAEPTPKPTQEKQVAEAEEKPTATPDAAQPSAANPGDADAAANIASNVRSGPGVNYGIIGGVQTGEKFSLIGRNNDKSWYQVRLGDDTEGWIFAQLVTVNSSVDTGALAVVEVEPPAVAAGGGAAPPVFAPAGGGSFELGGQTHTLANPTIMQMAGMNWVKFQHKWGPGDSPDGVGGRIQQAQANGFKVLLSIPGGSTYPGSIDFNSYVEFLRGVASYGPNAIEIWNEENIDFEWPAGQINPTTYVNSMLAPAYNAIKSANSSVMVISGAPAPTGFDNGTNAWADDRYMAGVAAAGGANYMDCIGVHYNAGATSPSASSGHPAGNNHYSWYFGPTLNMYYNAFGGSRPVCFTELGYLSGTDYGGVPSRFSWASNTTVAQHAQWLAEAASLSANSGRVRLMIIFNVDFTQWGEDPQAGYAMLRKDGSCPSCGLLGQVMGR